jgi:L-iditol 2-dehydrogenase
MGLLNVQTACALGTKEVWGVEPDETRRDRARQLGARRALTPREMSEVAAATDFVGADYVVVGPGSPEVILQSLQYVRPGGTVLLFAPTPPKVTTSLDLGDLYFREIRLIPSYSCGPEDTRRAYELLRTGKVDPRPIITHRFSLEQVQEAYNTAKGGGAALKVIVEFPGVS